MTNAKIVIGTDGSANAEVALESALRVAHQVHAPLDVVHAWEVRRPAVAIGPREAELLTHLSSQARSSTHEQLRRVRASLGIKNVAVRVLTPQGAPAQVLTAASRGAQLLVVGRIGADAFTRSIHGSVSAACLTTAPCPVLVVPAGLHETSEQFGVVVAGSDGTASSAHIIEAAAHQAMIRGARLRVIECVTASRGAAIDTELLTQELQALVRGCVAGVNAQWTSRSSSGTAPPRWQSQAVPLTWSSWATGTFRTCVACSVTRPVRTFLTTAAARCWSWALRRASQRVRRTRCARRLRGQRS